MRIQVLAAESKVDTDESDGSLSLEPVAERQTYEDPTTSRRLLIPLEKTQPKNRGSFRRQQYKYASPAYGGEDGNVTRQ